MPDLVMCALTSSMDTSFLWKIPAASAAAAPVLSKTSLKCSGEPAPLEAITGMVTASDTALTSSRSKPSPLQHKKMSQAFGGEGRGFIHTLICTFLSRSGYEFVKTSMAATYTKSGAGLTVHLCQCSSAGFPLHPGLQPPWQAPLRRCHVPRVQPGPYAKASLRRWCQLGLLAQSIYIPNRRVTFLEAHRDTFPFLFFYFYIILSVYFLRCGHT